MYRSEQTAKKHLKYSSIHFLRQELENAEIPFYFREAYNGWQILYPSKENIICSIIEHEFSFGSDDDLLEIYGIDENGDRYNDAIGHLTTEEVFNIIKKHYQKSKNNP